MNNVSVARGNRYVANIFGLTETELFDAVDKVFKTNTDIAVADIDITASDVDFTPDQEEVQITITIMEDRPYERGTQSGLELSIREHFEGELGVEAVVFSHKKMDSQVFYEYLWSLDAPEYEPKSGLELCFKELLKKIGKVYPEIVRHFQPIQY